MTRIDCYPWWHAKYAPLRAAQQVTVSSGCGTSGGNVQCEPEAMRASAERQLAGVIDGKLSLEAYTLARYMQAEVGSGTLEERVAVGEAAVNRSKKLPRGVLSLLLYRQSPGHPNYGYYGPIHGSEGVTTAPYGRWASTSRDPTVLTILLAQLVADGKTGNFNRGADDQDGLEYTAAFPDPAWKVRYQAAKGSYWVGPLPGVDHWKTFLWRDYGVKSTDPEGARLLEQGLAAVADRARPSWPADMPTCSQVTGSKIALAIGGLAVGAWLTTREIKLPWS